MLRKYLFKKPQLFLLLKIIPVVCFNVLVIFMSQIPIWAAIGSICLFDATSNVFSRVPNEVVYNYVSVDAKASTLGVTRFIEQIGYVAAPLLGGLFLDNINELYLVILSLSLYLISVIPLVVFYVKNRRMKGFNVEGVSTAAEQAFVDDNKNSKITSVRKKFLNRYLLTTFLVCFMDSFYVLLPFWLYITEESFFLAGLAYGVFDGVYAVGCIVVGWIQDKKDIKIAACIIGVLTCLMYIPILFVPDAWLKLVIFSVNGLTYPVITIWLYQTQLSKSHILGVGNRGLINFTDSMLAAGAVVNLSVLSGVIIPGLIVGIVGGLIGSFYMVRNERKTTELIVDFLHDNNVSAQKRE